MRKLLVLFGCSVGMLLAQASAIQRDLVYAHTPDRDLKLDLYLPASQNRPSPVILYIHGGGWSSGSKEKPPAGRLVAKGYAFASIDYRLSSEATFPAQIYDCKAAVRWLRANAAKYHLDPDHIVAWGGSAGGHLAALLGASGGQTVLEGNLGNEGVSSRVQAVIDFFGPTDFFQLNTKRRQPRPETDTSPEAKLVGGPLAQHADVARAANPITYVSKDCPPFLILHGDQDDTVPPDQSRLLMAALTAHGVPAAYRIIPGRTHGFREGPDINPLVDAFLQRYAPVAAPIKQQTTKAQ